MSHQGHGQFRSCFHFPTSTVVIVHYVFSCIEYRMAPCTSQDPQSSIGQNHARRKGSFSFELEQKKKKRRRSTLFKSPYFVQKHFWCIYESKSRFLACQTIQKYWLGWVEFYRYQQFQICRFCQNVLFGTKWSFKIVWKSWSSRLYRIHFVLTLNIGSKVSVINGL